MERTIAFPFYSSGDSVEVYGNYSDVDSGNVQSGLLSFGITGKGSVWGARYNKRLGDPRNSEAKLSVGLESKRFKSAVLLSGYDLGGEIAVRPLNINYTNQWPVSGGPLTSQSPGVRTFRVHPMVLRRILLKIGLALLILLGCFVIRWLTVGRSRQAHRCV